MPKWNKYSLVYEHADWIAVNKPFGVSSIADRSDDPSLVDLLQKQYDRLWTVHRLDKDTSGLILFAKNEHAHRALSMLFEKREIRKTYIGIAHGQSLQAEGEIEAPLLFNDKENKMQVHPKGKPSLTRYEVVESFGLMSVMRFYPQTGRTHQIRIHSQHIGRPLLCDAVYGNGKPVFISQLKRAYKLSKDEREKPIIDRLALHSYSLDFTYKNERYGIETPLLKDMQALIEQLRKHS